MAPRARYFIARDGDGTERRRREVGRGREMGEVCARRDACVGLHRETTGDTSRARRRIDAEKVAVELEHDLGQGFVPGARRAAATGSPDSHANSG